MRPMLSRSFTNHMFPRPSGPAMGPVVPKLFEPKFVTAPVGVMRQTSLLVTHRLWSGPTAIPSAPGSPGRANSVNARVVGFSRTTGFVPLSVNQILLSGPSVIPLGLASVAASVISSTTAPAGVMRPILPAIGSVNQRLPSGPDVMEYGSPATGNSVTTPAVLARPIMPWPSVNQMFPSGPTVIGFGANLSAMPEIGIRGPLTPVVLKRPIV